MSGQEEANGLEIIRNAATAIDGEALLSYVGDARFVLLGASTHGSHEFYRTRMALTRLLIERKGFHAVAIEADWPDAYRVNRYIRGVDNDRFGIEALSEFTRFPAWLWRNTDVLALVEWLRSYNDQFSDPSEKIGFYGLDLYSLYRSMSAVVSYLDKVDPDAAKRAQERYACFDHYLGNPQAYGEVIGLGIGKSCEIDLLDQLVDMTANATQYASPDDPGAEDEAFFAEQSARVAKNAEAYYRAIFEGHEVSWNLRDRHMAETLQVLEKYYRRYHSTPKIVVWAHNAHVGDARYTQRGNAGEISLGQLIRKQFPHKTLLIGFTTYTGMVTATFDWDEFAQQKRLNPALQGSFEHLFHDAGFGEFMILMRNQAEAARVLNEQRLERAVGVIYRPETEAENYYFQARLYPQFDAVIHYDETHAVVPLDRPAHWQEEDLPETYPSGV